MGEPAAVGSSRKDGPGDTWIALLRAVNIGTRRYLMADLRAALTAAGYTDVETHIHTGNVRLTGPETTAEAVERRLEAIFAADRGFPVATFALRPAEVAELAEQCAELSGLHRPEFGHYVSILRSAPSAALIDAVEDLRRPHELLVVRGRAVHLLYDVPYHEAKVSHAALEKLAGEGTNRNARVVLALAAKWAG